MITFAEKRPHVNVAFFMIFLRFKLLIYVSSCQEILVDRTVHAAVGRYLHSDTRFEKHIKPTLVRDDFSQAMHEFLPVAMRDITKTSPEGGRSGWDDVGGLTDIQNAIKEV